MPPSLSSSKKAKPARHGKPKTIPLLHSKHTTAPLLHCNHKTNPFLNNDSNTLLIHLHLYLARTVPVHFQIMAKNSNCLQQKIPVPYRRNRDTVYIQNLIRFNQLCLIFSLYRSLHKYMSRIPCNLFKNFRFLVIYLLKCLFAFLFQYQSDAFIIFFFSARILFILILTLFMFPFLFPVLVPVLSLFILILTLFMFPFLFPVLVPVQ